MKRLNECENPKKKVLFLGYDETQTEIIQALINEGCLVDHTSEKVTAFDTYDFAVSYGYRHIIKPNVIEEFGRPIFNLHISYLPYNRGAHPNFWSFYDNTPSGVTVHVIDDGIDTGPIVKQRYVKFDKEHDTFEKTYAVLIKEVETLFLECVSSLISDQWTATKQTGLGSYHSVNDLPTNFAGWQANINDEIAKLHKEGLKNE